MPVKKRQSKPKSKPKGRFTIMPVNPKRKPRKRVNPIRKRKRKVKK